MKNKHGCLGRMGGRYKEVEEIVLELLDFFNDT